MLRRRSPKTTKELGIIEHSYKSNLNKLKTEQSMKRSWQLQEQIDLVKRFKGTKLYYKFMRAWQPPPESYWYSSRLSLEYKLSFRWGILRKKGRVTCVHLLLFLEFSHQTSQMLGFFLLKTYRLEQANRQLFIKIKNRFDANMSNLSLMIPFPIFLYNEDLW